MSSQEKKTTIQKLMLEQMESLLGRVPGNHFPHGVVHRNDDVGHLVTELENLEASDFKTPKRKLETEQLKRYGQRLRCINKVLFACFCLGLSSRKAAVILAPILGARTSARGVSLTAKALQQEVTEYSRHFDTRKDRDPKILSAAAHAYRKLGSRWKRSNPTTLALLEKDLDHLLASFQIIKPQLLVKLRSNNLIIKSLSSLQKTAH